MRVGDVVQLGGHGPQITIIKEVPGSNPPSVDVAWYDYNTQAFKRDSFPVAALQPYVIPPLPTLVYGGSGLQSGGMAGAAPPMGLAGMGMPASGNQQKMKAASTGSGQQVSGSYPTTYFVPKGSGNKQAAPADNGKDDESYGNEKAVSKLSQRLLTAEEVLTFTLGQPRKFHPYGASQIGHSSTGKDV